MQTQFNNAMEYKRYWTPKFHEAERLHRRVPDELPHPDDIVLHGNGRVEFVGPCLPQEQKRMEEVVAHLKEVRQCIAGLMQRSGDPKIDKIIRTLRGQWNKLTVSCRRASSPPFLLRKRRGQPNRTCTALTPNVAVRALLERREVGSDKRATCHRFDQDSRMYGPQPGQVLSSMPPRG
jgi:hypothetical protein